MLLRRLLVEGCGERRGGGVTDGDGYGGEARRRGAGTGGSDDRGLGLAEEPLDGLAVGLVTKLASELEDTGGTNDGHADAPPSAVDLAVAVLCGRFLDG